MAGRRYTAEEIDGKWYVVDSRDGRKQPCASRAIAEEAARVGNDKIRRRQ